MTLLLFIFLLIYSVELQSDESQIISSLKKVLPEGMSVQSIKKSQAENLYIVDLGDLKPLYVSKDGEFSYYGELYAINGHQLENTTKDEINLKRKKILEDELG